MHSFRLRLVAALLLGITMISVASTYFDVLAHKHTMRSDLVRRTQWFAAGLQSQIEQQLNMGSAINWPEMLRELRQRPDQPALAIFDNQGRVLASIGDTSPLQRFPEAILQRSLAADQEVNAFVRIPDIPNNGGNVFNYTIGRKIIALTSRKLWHEDALPLHDGGGVVGTLLILTDADYIRIDGIEIWKRELLRIAAIVVFVVAITLAMVRWFMQKPISRAADWLRRLRHGEANVEDGAHEFGYLVPIAKEVSTLAEHLTRARAAAENEARLRDQAEHVWTADRLAVHVRNNLGSDQLFVVSNREPYMHIKRGGEIECIVPPSGLVTAIEPILRACDGTWIAHGSGSEDAVFVDAHDRLRVPQDEMSYTLRRVWIDAEEEAGYYEGFSNEGLWPLCHIAHTRPVFRADD